MLARLEKDLVCSAGGDSVRGGDVGDTTLISLCLPMALSEGPSTWAWFWP